MSKVPRHYVPSYLSNKAKSKAKKELIKSRRAYKKNKYYTRKKIPGYKSKKSKWVDRVKKIYGLDPSGKITLKKLSNVTKCKKSALSKIIKKGQGAYYSSGSRPNQTPHSWGMARLYSSISGGPAARIDKHILMKGCKKNSKALKLANNVKKPLKKPYVSLKGGGRRRYFKNERLINIVKSKRPGKKYTAYIKHKRTHKIRKLHFGASKYEQYKDSTNVGAFTNKNHGSKKRRENYFKRHSGVPGKQTALAKEWRKSKGMYTPKILSHKYLW